MQRSIARRYALYVVMIASMALSACGGGDENEPTKVAAKVNKDEITVQQVNQAMQRLSNVAEAQVKQAQKQVLDRLVDQQLLVQQAIEKKLDRDPKVIASIEASRRQVLAQAYIQQVMGGAAKGSEEAVKDFYEEHPELFQERRIYRFAQLAIAAQGDKQQAIRAKLEELDRQADKGRILVQLAEWLREENLQFRATQNTQAAEQLPIEALPRYHQMKAGDLLFQPGPQGVVVSQLTASQTQPLNEEQARPFIEQFLQNKERLKLSEDEMKRLRAAAKIEYVGDFATLQQAQPGGSQGSASDPWGAPQPADQPAAGPGPASEDDKD